MVGRCHQLVQIWCTPQLIFGPKSWIIRSIFIHYIPPGLAIRRYSIWSRGRDYLGIARNGSSKLDAGMKCENAQEKCQSARESVRTNRKRQEICQLLLFAHVPKTLKHLLLASVICYKENSHWSTYKIQHMSISSFLDLKVAYTPNSKGAHLGPPHLSGDLMTSERSGLERTLPLRWFFVTVAISSKQKTSKTQ